MTVNVDAQEIAKFAALSAHWWDPDGELKTLHQVNPLRVRYITEIANLAGKKVLDIGCGGGLLTESLAQLGAQVTGIDLSKEVIEVAKLHQLESKTNVTYHVMSAEDCAGKYAGQFDIVTCLELLEHVPDPKSTVAAASALLKPGGEIFFSTLNRNPKSYLYAILGAEYIFKVLPKNTHEYGKFIKPHELNNWAREAKLIAKDLKGISYNPFTQHHKLTDDVSVNYIFYATKNVDGTQ